MLHAQLRPECLSRNINIQTLFTLKIIHYPQVKVKLLLTPSIDETGPNKLFASPKYLNLYVPGTTSPLPSSFVSHSSVTSLVPKSQSFLFHEYVRNQSASLLTLFHCPLSSRLSTAAYVASSRRLFRGLAPMKTALATDPRG